MLTLFSIVNTEENYPTFITNIVSVSKVFKQSGVLTPSVISEFENGNLTKLNECFDISQMRSPLNSVSKPDVLLASCESCEYRICYTLRPLF